MVSKQALCPSYVYSIFHCLSIYKRTTHTCIIPFCSVSISVSIAPPGINPLEHEELPMSVQQVQQNVRPTLAAVPQMSTERHLGAFSQITALPKTFAVKHDDTVSLHRARMDNRDVVLRVLKGKLSWTKPNFNKVQLLTVCLLKECREMFCFALFWACWRYEELRNGLITGLQTLELGTF